MKFFIRVEAFGLVVLLAILSAVLAVTSSRLPDGLGMASLTPMLEIGLIVLNLTCLGLMGMSAKTWLRRIRRINKSLSSLLPRSEDLQDRYTDAVEHLELTAQQISKHIANLNVINENRVARDHLMAYKSERLEAIVETLPDAVVFLDDKGITITCNEKFGLLTGVDAQQILGKNFTTWPISAAIQTAIGELLTNLRTGLMGQTHFEPDDERRIGVFGRTVYALRTPDRRLGVLLVLRDVTDEWQAHKGRDEFIAHVAHELKSPLGNVMVYGEELRALVDSTNAFAVDCANTVCDEADRMTRLINNLLDISRIEAGTMGLDLQRVRLHDLFEDCMENVAYSAKAKGITTKSNIPPDMAPVHMDKSMIRVAISNLLNNAVKYNRPGGQIELIAEETPDGVVLAVQDTGIGIPEADIPHLFVKHYRAKDSEAEDRGGHGLGLYLVKRIVDLHHGKIDVTSQHGKGSRFQLTLPTTAVLL